MSPPEPPSPLSPGSRPASGVKPSPFGVVPAVPAVFPALPPLPPSAFALPPLGVVSVLPELPPFPPTEFEGLSLGVGSVFSELPPFPPVELGGLLLGADAFDDEAAPGETPLGGEDLSLDASALVAGSPTPASRLIVLSGLPAPGLPLEHAPSNNEQNNAEHEPTTPNVFQTQFEPVCMVQFYRSPVSRARSNENGHYRD